MKKMLCLILSVIITLSAFSILAFADSTPVISIATDKQTVRRNNIVTATVKVSKNSKICAATIEFFYDKDYFSVDSAEVNGSLGMEVINDGAGKGKIRYAVANDNTITAETTLFTVKLKVKKPNGKLSLDFEEVWVDNNGATENVTAGVKAKYNSLPETVLSCNHDLKETILSEPTCEKDGAKAQECKICGWKAESTPIKAKGHTTKTVTVAPTCTKNGKTYKECTVCGKKFDETVVKAKGHDNKFVTVEPTCDKNGETYFQCKVCGWKSDSVVIKARHKAGDWEVVKEATGTESGKKVKKCTVCGKVVEEAEFSAKGDVDGNGRLTATDARMILRYVAGLEKLTLSQRTNADVNGDYKITAVDARQILRVVAGLE